jgi:hypothetical protein
MTWKIGICTVALALLLANRNAARADILFSNIAPSSQDGADPVITPSGSNMFGGPLADSFSTPAQAYNLTDVMVNLTGTADTGFLSIDLLSDNSTSPGAVLTNLGTVSDLAFNGSLQTFDFPQAPYPLAANTRYWVQLSSTTSSAQWNWSIDTLGTGVASEFYANSNGVFPNSDGPYEMEVSATPVGVAVPEPPSLVLAFLGLATLASVVGAGKRNRVVSI